MDLGTGVTVSWTLYLLGAELDQVSPRIRPRAELELSRRILNPVADRDNFGWMALNVSSPVHRPNNWTPWIAASVLTSALASDTDAERRVQIVHKMLRSLDGFLRFHPADGSCDEGPGYWGHAGGSLLDGLELLYSASGGKIDFFGEPLIQEIGRFIYRAHICHDYWVPVGDCAARFEPERDVVFRYGRRINDATLKVLAAQGATAEGLLGSRFLGREVNALFDAREVLSFQPGTGQLLGDVWLPSEELQLMAARSQPGSSAGLYLAAWGGHNAQSHNHNDVGNFLVFANGQPVFIDPGAPTYTAQTFSARRYEIWAFQSAFHNLPTINGFTQEAGRQFAARNVKCETNAATAELEMDIAAAYPAKAKVKSWRRTLRLTRNQEIQVTEHFELAEVTGETRLNLMTPLEPDIRQPGLVLLGQTNPIRLEYDAATLMPSTEQIALEDGRLAKAWGPCLYRLVLRPKAPTRSGTWTLRIRQERGKQTAHPSK